MRIKLLIGLCVLSAMVAAQSVQVGDSVMVKSTTERYLTGEKISNWVYTLPHKISQVGTKQYANGVLLDIDGARSWLDINDVYVAGQQPKVAPVPQTEPAPKPIETPAPVVVEEPAPVVAPKVEPEPVVETEVAAQATPEKEEKNNKLVAKTLEWQDRQNLEMKPRRIVDPKFQMIADMGVLFREYTYGLATDMLFGARLNQYFFVGGGVGFHGWLSGQSKIGHYTLQFPIYADGRFYLPSSSRATPFINLGIGGTLGMLEKETEGVLTKSFHAGVYTRADVGLQFNGWSLCLGYDYGPASTIYFGWVLSLMEH